MLWDGLGFFGTDHTKLGRLKGEKVDFLTPYKSIRSVIVISLMLSVGIYILVTEISKLGTQKSQTVSFIENVSYNYNFTEAIPLHSAIWFYVDELIPHIRAHQIRNEKE